MTSSATVYITQEGERSVEGAKYFFISEGEKNLIKAVEYAYVGIKNNRLTYNLGFGTVDENSLEVSDGDISNNGDQYKVFNTVLSTVPAFLHNYPGAMVMVAGSDSGAEYKENCRKICAKKCIPPSCRNSNRRINIYRGYVDKNYDLLSADYQFWGGIMGADNEHVILDYQKVNSYDAVFFIKK